MYVLRINLFLWDLKRAILRCSALYMLQLSLLLYLVNALNKLNAQQNDYLQKILHYINPMPCKINELFNAFQCK